MEGRFSYSIILAVAVTVLMLEGCWFRYSVVLLGLPLTCLRHITLSKCLAYSSAFLQCLERTGKMAAVEMIEQKTNHGRSLVVGWESFNREKYGS